jgi:MarR family transcriptional regulator, organic hydroperoxide resistance regulator
MSEPDLSPAEMLRRSLERLELATIRHRATMRRRLDLSDDELVVLLFVARNDDASLRMLGSLTGLSRSGTGSLVQRLERKRFVERCTDRHDRRMKRIRLLRQGAERLDAARAVLAADVDQLAEEMTDAELVHAHNVLDRLAHAADARAGSAADDAPAPMDNPVWRQWA